MVNFTLLVPNFAADKIYKGRSTGILTAWPAVGSKKSHLS